MPNLRVTLHGEPRESLCTFKLEDYAKTSYPDNPDIEWSNDILTYPTRNDVIDETGWFPRSYIFQNFQPCIPSLPAATRIRFSSLSSSGVRFCLQDLSLLPSQVAPAGECCLHNTHVPIRQLPGEWHTMKGKGCKSTSFKELSTYTCQTARLQLCVLQAVGRQYDKCASQMCLTSVHDKCACL